MKKIEMLILLLIIGLDQLTKSWIESILQLHESIELIPGFFSLTYARNTGAAWSMLAGQMTFFIVLTSAVLCGLIWLMVKTPKESTWTRISFSLIMGGAIGNFIDRISLKYVVDFIYVKIINFPIFNLADCYITVSVIVMMLLILFYYSDDEFEFIFPVFSGKNKKDK